MMAQAQGWKEKKATYYADEAVKEFKLTSEQREQIYHFKFDEFALYQEIVKKNKNGGFVNEEEFNWK